MNIFKAAIIPAALGGLVLYLQKGAKAQAQQASALPTSLPLPDPVRAEVQQAAQIMNAANTEQQAAIEQARAAVAQLAQAEQNAQVSPTPAAREQVAAAAQQVAEAQATVQQATATRAQTLAAVNDTAQRAAQSVARSSAPPAPGAVDQRTRVTVAAKGLRAYLLNNPRPAAFGSEAQPSPQVADFQRVAGLKVDGIVGPSVRAAAAAVNIILPKRPRDSAAVTKAVTPVLVPSVPTSAPAAAPVPVPVQQAAAAIVPVPPPGFDRAKAKALAPRVEAELRRNKSGYNRKLISEFQVAAGIKPDGLYGGGTRGALVHYGQRSAPAPMFKPVQTQPYPWK